MPVQAVPSQVPVLFSRPQVRQQVDGFYDRIRAIKQALRAEIEVIAAACGWASIQWEGEHDYDDEGGTAFSLHSMSITTHAGDTRHVADDCFNDWESIIDDQADNAHPDPAMDKAIEDGEFPAFQAARLGVTEETLFAVIDAAVLLAYEEASTGSMDFPSKAAAA